MLSGIVDLTPAQGKRYQRQRRRCHLCGQVFTAQVRQARTPMDNNLCERALKQVILHPRNAMFSK
jgi:transposase-like protein